MSRSGDDDLDVMAAGEGGGHEPVGSEEVAVLAGRVRPEMLVDGSNEFGPLGGVRFRIRAGLGSELLQTTKGSDVAFSGG
jgi:hypothetical protein